MQSFLNLIDISTGRQVRLAEFGFEASSPSFCEDGVSFERGGSEWLFDLSTGLIKKRGETSTRSDCVSDVKLNFISELENGFGHCELVAHGKVIARFMGSEKSLGAVPEKDGKVVFIGYPSPEGIN